MTDRWHRLLGSEPRAFAQGRCSCKSQPVTGAGKINRLVIPIAIDNLLIEQAVIDTGGAYFVIDPDLGGSLGLNPSSALLRERLRIRGEEYFGGLHRLSVTFVAEEGESLTFQATTFIPEPGHGSVWPLPVPYIGWQGCLERVRFAIDPDAGEMYFGAL